MLGDLAHDWTTRDLRDGPAVAFSRFEERGEAVQALSDALTRLMSAEPRSTVAVVARTPQVADLYFEGLRQSRAPKLRRVAEQDFSFTAGVDVTDIRQVKGLEYDYVIALEVTAEHYPLEEPARHLLEGDLRRRVEVVDALREGRHARREGLAVDVAGRNRESLLLFC